MSNKANNSEKPANVKSTEAPSGNASNPSSNTQAIESAGGKPLLDKKAEKYLRESGNIEDMPDAEDQQDIDKTNR